MHVNDMTENSIIESGEFSRPEIISFISIQKKKKTGILANLVKLIRI